jgi:hypothetical protein
MRRLFHPRGQMRRLPDGGVVHVKITANCAHHDLSRVQPDADLDHGRVRAPHLVRVPLDVLLHPERRALKIGEEDRDLFALAFEGALGREDLLGEVLGSVALG